MRKQVSKNTYITDRPNKLMAQAMCQDMNTKETRQGATMAQFKIEKLDFNALYEEAEKENRFGLCPICEEEHMLCWCGVCFKYCHNDYCHEPIDDLELV